MGLQHIHSNHLLQMVKLAGEVFSVLLQISHNASLFSLFKLSQVIYTYEFSSDLIFMVGMWVLC